MVAETQALLPSKIQISHMLIICFQSRAPKRSFFFFFLFFLSLPGVEHNLVANTFGGLVFKVKDSPAAVIFGQVFQEVGVLSSNGLGVNHDLLLVIRQLVHNVLELPANLERLERFETLFLSLNSTGGLLKRE